MFKRLSLVLALVLVLVLVVVSMLSGCGSPQPPQKSELKIGSLPRIYDLIAYIAQQEGLFEKQQIKVEIISFRSTVEMNSTLLAGELDGIIQGLFEAINLNKEKETVKTIGHSTMPHMFEIIVSPGSNITTPVQLKNKEIAVATGTIMDYALDRLLKAEGIENKDITKVNVPSMPLRLEVLRQGKVPAAILGTPLSDLAVLSGGKIILDDTKQPFGGPGLVFSMEALKNKPDAIGRFFKAWQEAVELINANPEKYRSLLTEVAKVPEPVSKSIKVPTFPKLSLPAEAELEQIVSWMMSQKMLSKQLTYKEVVETKYLK